MITYIFISTIVLFIMWVVTANVMEYTKEGYPMYVRAPATLFSIFFVFVDVVYDFTAGSVIFLQLPSFSRPTLTQRLKYIFETERRYSWRYKLAYFACKYLISPWQWNHCGLKLGTP